MDQEMSLEDLKNLFELHEDSATDDNDPDEILKSIRKKLYTMFCSPMKEDYTHEAFRWVSQLCLSMGNKFWFSNETGWTSEDAKIFSCLARLSIVEIQILLPLIERHLTFGDEEELENGKIVARSAKSNDYDKFGDHLVIIESVIKCLVEGQELEEEERKKLRFTNDKKFLTDFIRGEELRNLLDRIKEAMGLVCDYLEQVHIRWHELARSEDSEMFACAEAALRIMSVWLADDPDSFRAQCQRFLIDLLIKNLLLSDRPSRDDLYILALHSICTQDDKLMETLRAIPEHEKALNSYLKFVQQEQANHVGAERRGRKMFKLRCGLIKDLLTEIKITSNEK